MLAKADKCGEIDGVVRRTRIPGKPGPAATTASASRNPLCRRIFEVQRLARIYQRMNRVRRDRGLGEARQDQLELARIGRDVANREDTGPRRRAGRRIDADMVVLDIKPPSGERTEIGRETE